MTRFRGGSETRRKRAEPDVKGAINEKKEIDKPKNGL
jgi:hypothetical protein